MELKHILYALGLIAALILLFTPPIERDTPAPGCRVIFQGILVMEIGGCWGETVIKDLEVEPSHLRKYFSASGEEWTEDDVLRVNNCNGGIFIVSGPIKVNGVETSWWFRNNQKRRRQL